MKHLNKLASVFCVAAMGLTALTGCEGSDMFSVNSPDWLSEKIDSIEKSKGSTEEVLVGMNEDVYTVGNTDFSSGFWTSFSKYYVVQDNQKWNAVFNLNINPGDNTYYKNFALVVTNDVDRGGTGYAEYGAIRYDATGDSTKFNSQWGNLFFKYSTSNVLMDPVDNKDEKVQRLAGKVTLTVDRTRKDSFVIKMNNGAVTKVFAQPYKLNNLNPDASDTNIRCFLVPEGSYIDFLSTNIVPIGGTTSALDKNPISMTLNNVPDEVNIGADLNEAMANVTATVQYEEGVSKTIPASDLVFSAINDMDKEGEKQLIAICNKTFKGALSQTPITATAKFNVVQMIKSIAVTKAPTRSQYYFFDSPATMDLTDRTLSFDPTGLQVTATYENGKSAVIDHSKLTFTPVKAAAGSQEVTISTKNGKTAKVKITVSASKEQVVKVTPITLGKEDNTSDFWGALSNDVKIPVGQTSKITFTNYGGAANYNNFVVVLRNAALAEYGVVRADNYGWGNGYAACKLSGGQADWGTWLKAMNKAKVTVYITNCNNGTADVQAVMNGSDGNLYTQYYLGVNTIDPNDLNFSFTIDHSHIVFDK